MKILFNMGHPGQIHLFKNSIRELKKKGHECKITIIDKDVSLKLLDAYNFEYEVVGYAKPSIFGKATELLKIESRLFKICKLFKPDILVGGVGNAYVAHVGKLIGRPSIVFDDTEHAKLEHLLTDPFATVICTPSCFQSNLGKKQVRYNGYHELAYLHPNYFTPNPTVLNEIGLSEEDTLIVLRFVLWNADHDIGQYGIKHKIKFVNELEKYGQVLITSEGKLEPELERYKIKVSPDKLHDLLYYATLCIGEGATTAAESAILGTPSIYVSSLVGTMGNFSELEDKYGLIFSYEDSDEALKKAIKLLHDSTLKDDWILKKDVLLNEKIDVTKFMVQLISNYSEILVNGNQSV
ncbi:MAG TPA: DUF354 domain-containing protein [Methanosarcina sp.]|jgi:hypothetical protein|nr:DUF354 domain-containing protein [Methanosarcina sp.]